MKMVARRCFRRSVAEAGPATSWLTCQRASAAACSSSSMIISSMLLLVMVALHAGCQKDPYAASYTTVQPLRTNVVGLYALLGRGIVVDLAADGTFRATNVFPSVLPPGVTDVLSCLVTGSGTWRIATVGSIDKGKGDREDYWGVYLDSATTGFQPAGLIGNKPPYGLIFSFEGPHGTTEMVLQKRK